MSQGSGTKTLQKNPLTKKIVFQPNYNSDVEEQYKASGTGKCLRNL